MNQIRTQKDNLAKLMASENLTIVHKKVPTAYFDVKNRILCCPTFKDDLSPALYDLFMGHEVGHALNTPAEGLHDALEMNRTLKGYLNVVEDVRIEKAIKNKYPGLRKSFYGGYSDLMRRDFFGLKDRNLKDLSLIDKINLQTKVGTKVHLEWTDEEHDFLNWARRCSTWNDVVECSQAIYEWSKTNEKRSEYDEALVPQTYMPGPDDPDFDEDDDYETMEVPEGMEGEEESDSFGSSTSDEIWDDEIKDDKLPDLLKDSDPTDSDEESSSEEKNFDGSPRGGKSNSNPDEYHDEEDGAREAITEHNAHNNEELFLEEKPIIRTQIDLTSKFKEYKDLKQVLYPYKRVLADWKEFWKEVDPYRDKVKGKARATFTRKKHQAKNKKLIAHMAKEFEMKQTAKRAAKAFTAKTGVLDMNRLAKYQIVDDVFKRITYLPDGKNHGITVLLDWSGSIYKEVGDLLEQAFVLTEFCRKVQIPFRIYLFSDVMRRNDERISEDEVMASDCGSLVEIFSDKMRPKEYLEMFDNMSSLWNNYFSDHLYGRKYNKHVENYNKWFDGFDQISANTYVDHETRMSPYQYSLGGTPLNHTLLALRKLLPDFNREYGIEKSILTVITDGYSHESDLLRMDDGESRDRSAQKETLEDKYGASYERDLIDPYSRKVYPYETATNNGHSEFTKTQNILHWLSEETGVSVTGYFCLGGRSALYNLYYYVRKENEFIDYKAMWKRIRKDGEVLKIHGYNKLFLTAANKLGILGEDTLADEFIDAKKVRVLAAFKRNQRNKNTSRFLTNEFIKEIA